MLARNELIAGRYRIVRWIGEGACATVYEAADAQLGDRAVAIKIMSEELVTRPLLRARFVQEAEAALHIDSPFVVGVHAVGSLDDGRPYIVMELLDGEDLGRLLERIGSLEEQRAVELAIHALSGLAHAHSRGVLHRDIKPANLFIVKPSDDAGGGEDEILKIVDFGISKVLTSGPQSHGLTRTNVVLGSPVYMSPEQCRGAKNMDHRSDVYSLGVVLYECLTGHRPHGGDNVNEIMFEIALKDAPDPRTHKPSLDPALAAIVMKALARDPEERFQSASAFREALLEWGAERGARVPPTPSSSNRMRVLTPRRLRALEVTLDDEEEPAGPAAPVDSESPPHVRRLRDALEPDPETEASRRRLKIAAIVGVSAVLGAIALFIFFGPTDTRSTDGSATATSAQSSATAIASVAPEPPVVAPEPSASASAPSRLAGKAAAKPLKKRSPTRKPGSGPVASAEEGKAADGEQPTNDKPSAGSDPAADDEAADEKQAGAQPATAGGDSVAETKSNEPTDNAAAEE